MTNNLKQETINGLGWSFIDNFSNRGLQFIIGIILARILSPKEFGLIGIITVFIAISQTFVDSGFSNSLIRKKNCTQDDYCTIFYFNLIASICIYFLLFFLAGFVSRFYNEPRLVEIIRVLGISLVINSFSIVQTAILTKNINFKLQTKISIVSTLISGIAGITLAYSGLGVWSLVWKTLSSYFATALLLWFWSDWYPIKLFSFRTFKEHFLFGYKLLLSGLLETISKNVNYLVIGKFFSVVELGYYTRAEQFSNLPSSNINGVVMRVSFPVLARLQNEPEKFKRVLQKIIKGTMFITFILMIGLAVTAKPLVLSLIGSKWSSSILYLQLLCCSAMFYPLHAINLNILVIRGRSDLFLKLEMIKKLFIIPILIVAIFLGLKAMLMGLIIFSVIAFFMNSYWSGIFANYNSKEQIMDILPYFFLALFMGIILGGLGLFIKLIPVYTLIIQMLTGVIIVIFLSEIFKLESYLEFKQIISIKLLSKKK